VHYDGWTHFTEPAAQLRSTLDRADPTIARLVTWLQPGMPTDLRPHSTPAHELP
jgi:hypothetical protein